MKLKELARRLRINFWNEFRHYEWLKWSNEYFKYWGVIVPITIALMALVNVYLIILVMFPLPYSFCWAIYNSIKRNPDYCNMGRYIH